MCLKIDNSVTLPKPNKKGLIKGYKKVSITANSAASINYPNYQWQAGWNYSGRTNPTLTLNEKTTRIVSNGLHVYKHNEGRLKGLPPYYQYAKLRVYFKPEDVIAKGVTDKRFSFFKSKSFVVTKVFVEKREFQRLRKFMEIRKRKLQCA